MAPPPVVWQCFNLANGEAPNAPFRITTNNFGNDKITVRKAVMLCEEAVKTRVTGAGGVTQIGHATGRVFECYRVTGSPVQQPFVLHTRNFGPDAVRVTRPGLMCEPAKKTPIPNFPPFEDTPPSVEPPTGG